MPPAAPVERRLRFADADGRDPDHPLSLAEVGKCGVSIVSLKDMERLFEGIPLDRPEDHDVDDHNSPASMIFAMYLWLPSSMAPT